jgi:hypothetical protein
MQKTRTADPAVPFIGTWRLVSVESHIKSGEQVSVRNENPEGLLIYDACGNIAAQLMWHGRKPFVSGNQRGGTPEEIRKAFEGYSAYFGAYTVDPQAGTVTHRVRGSLLPNWIGESLVRYYKFDGVTLTLRTPPVQVGERQITYILLWRKEI